MKVRWTFRAAGLPLSSLGAEMLCGGVSEESRKASREAELRGTPSDGGAPTENIAATRGANQR